MRECKKYQSMLSCAIDGELDDDKRRALSHHLAQCADCRRVFAQMQLAKTALINSASEPPAGLLDGVMHSISNAASVQNKPRKKAFIRYTSAAACLALVLLIGFAALHNGVGGADNMEKASAPESFYSADSALNDVYESETISDSGGAWMEPTEQESVTEESANDFDSSFRGFDDAESQAICIELDGVLYSYNGHEDIIAVISAIEVRTLSYDEIKLPDGLETDEERSPHLQEDTLYIPAADGGWYLFLRT